MPEEMPVSVPASAPEPSPQKANERVGLRVSLIPEEELRARDPGAGFRKFLLISAIGTVALGAACGALWTFAGSRQSQAVSLRAKTAELKKEASGLSGEVASAKQAKERLGVISKILKTHATGLGVLEFFEGHVLPMAAFTSLAVDEHGAATLGVKAKDYETYSAQINEFRLNAPEAKEVDGSGVQATYNPDDTLKQVDFTLTMKVDPALFSSIRRLTIGFLRRHPYFLSNRFSSVNDLTYKVDAGGAIKVSGRAPKAKISEQVAALKGDRWLASYSQGKIEPIVSSKGSPELADYEVTIELTSKALVTPDEIK